MNMKLLVPATIASAMVAIMGTGLLLNVMGSGSLGTMAQNLAVKITKGYGV